MRLGMRSVGKGAGDDGDLLALCVMIADVTMLIERSKRPGTS